VIGELTPYEETKPTGLSWLERVPAAWDRTRIKYLFREQDERSGDGTGLLLSLTRARGLIPHSEATDRMASAEDLSNYKVCQPGDLVMNRMQAWSGMFAVSAHEGLVSPDYSVFRAVRAANVRYFMHLCQTPPFVAEFARRSKGIGSGFNRLYTSEFGAIHLFVPPVDEQNAIVRFVAHIDQRITRFTETKRRLVGLLDEQRRAIVDRMVTQGEGGATIVPVDVESLSETAAHWETRPFVRCCIDRADYRGATPRKTEEGVFLVTAKNIKKGWIDYKASTEYVNTAEYDTIMRRGKPQVGDLLFTTEAPLGNFALVDREDVALAQRVIRFRLDPRLVVPDFALYAVLSSYFQHQLLRRATGSTALGIKASKLPQLKLVLPPLEEQEVLVAAIRSETRPLDRARSKAVRELMLVREYRDRLVSDVVTGRVDVRAATKRVDEPRDPRAAMPEGLELTEEGGTPQGAQETVA
jgi:type I restriction enzyme S subunit